MDVLAVSSPFPCLSTGKFVCDKNFVRKFCFGDKGLDADIRGIAPHPNLVSHRPSWRGVGGEGISPHPRTTFDIDDDGVFEE